MKRSCMGGWCLLRDHCSHYFADDSRRPSERLCVPGADGVGESVPIVLHRRAGTWESRQHQRMHAIGAALTFARTPEVPA